MVNNGLWVSINGGIPKWMVYFTENPYPKWMMTGGTPMSGNHQFMDYHQYIGYNPIMIINQPGSMNSSRSKMVPMCSCLGFHDAVPIALSGLMAFPIEALRNSLGLGEATIQFRQKTSFKLDLCTTGIN